MTNAATLSMVVESRMHAILLRDVLNSGRGPLTQIRYYATAGRVSLATVGRNILVDDGGPVLVVMDSDTHDRHQSQERLAMARYVMGAVNTTVSGYITPSGPLGSISVGSLGRFQVFAFVPQIEIVFFEAPPALERILKVRLPQETVEEGLLSPKQTLKKLLKESGSDYQAMVSALDPPAAQEIAAGKQATALRKSIDALLAAQIEQTLPT
jgi:hypothetical protein